MEHNENEQDYQDEQIYQDETDDGLVDPPEQRSQLLTIIIVVVSLLLIGIAVIGMIIYISWLKAQPVEVIQTTEIDFSIQPPTEEEINGWVVEASFPRYMNIPEMDMERAQIEDHGPKRGTSQLAEPSDIWNIAWYNRSAKPGEDGVGVYNCHTFFTAGGRCDGLGDLPVGSEIIVERGDGQTLSYEIVENNTVTLEEAKEYMRSKVFRLPKISGVKQSISIITCAGEYNGLSSIASHRTIVRAILK